MCTCDPCEHVASTHRDPHVARRNVADLTRYLDDQAAQLAVYAGAGEDTIPLMMWKLVHDLPAASGQFWMTLYIDCIELFTPAREYMNNTRPVITLYCHCYIIMHTIMSLTQVFHTVYICFSVSLATLK